MAFDLCIRHLVLQNRLPPILVVKAPFITLQCLWARTLGTAGLDPPVPSAGAHVVAVAWFSSLQASLTSSGAIGQKHLTVPSQVLSCREQVSPC